VISRLRPLILGKPEEKTCGRLKIDV